MHFIAAVLYKVIISEHKYEMINENVLISRELELEQRSRVQAEGWVMACSRLHGNILNIQEVNPFGAVRGNRFLQLRTTHAVCKAAIDLEVTRLPPRLLLLVKR